MNYLCWWNQNAGAVQAICSILGIIGLAIYCFLTHGIRVATVAQQKASQAPMLMFFKDEGKWDAGQTSWAIKNYGVGPAVNIWWKLGSANERSKGWYELGALGAGDESDLPHSSYPEDGYLSKMPEDGARIHYSDSAGNHYATWGSWKDNCFKQDWSSIEKKHRSELYVRRLPLPKAE